MPDTYTNLSEYFAAAARARRVVQRFGSDSWLTFSVQDTPHDA